MAPAAVGLLARSLCASACRSALTRWTGVLSRGSFIPVTSLSTQTAGPPKRPLNGYMRYVVQQKPIVTRENPEIKTVDIIRKIAQQWRMLTPEQKQPFQEASLQEREQFRLVLQRYRAQLTPDQIQQQTLEKRQRMAKRKAIRKKRELNVLGKPKRPRSPFNIFMSEHFEEARGTSTQAKMKSLLEDWRNLFSHQKKVYTQLAEDDKVRYKNEMKSWEEHMVEIGREDLVREKSQVRKKSPAKKTAKTKTKTVKKAAATRGAKAAGKKGKSSAAKTSSKVSTKTSNSVSGKTR